MKRIAAVAGALLLSAFFAIPASPDRRSARISTTKSFAIDGRRFTVEKPSNDPHSIRGEELRETSGGKKIDPSGIPHGLRADKSIRLETESGAVDIAFGDMESKGSQIRRRMSAAGWKCIEPPGGWGAVATMKNGKETTIVLLEEKEGKFLVLRRVE